jgi:hypothetical protein
MNTVSEIINKLKKEGYTLDFNLKQNHLECNKGHSLNILNYLECHDDYLLKIFRDEFIVDKHYRFEGISDPADEAVVYAISCPKHNIKGILVNGYGIYSERLPDEMIKALKIND